jgi:beta-galactosidase
MNSERSRSSAILLCILGTGLIVRVAAIALFHPPIFSDQIDYVALGRSLAHGGGYSLDGHPTAFRPPGYPLLLAFSFSLFGESLLPVRAAQACADLLSCFLVYVLGRKLFSERVGLIGAGIFALFPVQILYVPIIMSETVFTTLLVMYLVLCADGTSSWKQGVLAGIVLGAGALVRPTVLLLPAAIAAVRWIRGWTPGENLRALAITAAAALVVLSPWLIRNHDEFGRVSLTSNTGVNFWMGAHSGATGSYSFPPNNPLLAAKDEFEESDTGMRLGLAFIVDHPTEYGVILAKKWAHFFSVDYWLLLAMHEQPDIRSGPGAAVVFGRFPLSDIVALQGPFAAVLLLATFGVCFHAREGRGGIFALAAPVAYWILVHLVFVASARYRFPVVTLIMIGGAYGADLLLKKTYVRTPLRTVVFILFTLLFAAGWIAERLAVRRDNAEAAQPSPPPANIDSVRSLIAGMTFPVPEIPPPAQSVTGTDAPGLSLNGTWEIGFQGIAGADSGRIEVPGEWEMQGYRIRPRTPATYRGTFDIPGAWRGLRVYLRFDGVSSHCSVRVNGVPAGEHEGSFVPFAFDITRVARPGRNLIEAAVTCLTISDSLACTSQYAAHPVGGILRKVTLYALPQIHIAGLSFATRFGTGSRDALLDVTCALDGRDARVSPSLAYVLKDAGGAEILRSVHRVNAPAGSEGPGTDVTTLRVRSPRRWDPEHPNLYTLTTTLFADGRPVQSNMNRVGFREIQLRGNRLFLNGTPTKLRGINHHEVHPLRGRSLTPALCRQDVELLRAANCNYIRTSHYPPSEELLDACDELGMFVESEASLCWIAHGAAPIWNTMNYTDTTILSHMVRANIENVLAGRTHPCVIIWSLGNESRWSPLWERVNAEVRKLDPTRPTSFHDQSWGSYNNAGSRADIAVYHYPGFDGPAQCERTTDRPTLFGEYMHVQTYARREIETDPGVRGDSWATTLRQMVDSVYAHPACLGGAVWSGVDDIFHLSDSTICGYGAWGPLDGWRRKKPEYTGIRKSYSPVLIRAPVPAGSRRGVIRFTLLNRYNTTNLSEVGITAESGGKKIALRGNVPPLSTGVLEIDTTVFPGRSPILVSFRDPRGFICAEEAIARPDPGGASPAEKSPAVTLTTQDGSLILRAGDITFRISKRDGIMSSIVKGTDTVATQGCQTIIIPHNADDGGAPGTSGNNYTQDLRPLSYKAEENFRADSVTSRQDPDGSVTVDVSGSFGERLNGMRRMTFHPDGTVSVSYDYTALVDFTAPAKNLIRQFGILFTLPSRFDMLTWKRQGLWSLYPDDDPGRLQGTAKAHPRMSRFVEEPRRVPTWEWKENANSLGSNDFRGTKEHILLASLTGSGGRVFCVASDGTQGARAWVEGERVRFLVAGVNGPGSCTFFTGPRPGFPKGSHIRGACTISID